MKFDFRLRRSPRCYNSDPLPRGSAIPALGHVLGVAGIEVIMELIEPQIFEGHTKSITLL